MNAQALQIFGATAFAVVIALVVRAAIPSPTKLAGRLRPYTAVSRSAFGQTPDVHSIVLSSTDKRSGNALERMLRPLSESIARLVTGALGQTNQQTLAIRLRQAGIDIDLDDAQRVHNYRVRQVSKAVVFSVAGLLFSIATHASPASSLLFTALGAVLGAAQEPARLGRLLQTRVERMRIELYTINQQLAVHLRTGGSSIQAVQRIVRRGNGEVVSELREALRLHERGMSAARAFQRVADHTPEPMAARTYRLLGTGSERGSDLAEGLLALSEDVRDARREAMRRTATRRRGQMLIPTVGLMAPILILFIAAPLPSILFGAR